MAFPESRRNAMLDALTVSHIAAFAGDPQNGGTQTGSRVAVTLGAASGGTRSLSGTPSITIPASGVVNHLAYFDAATGGTLQASKAVDEESYTNEGTYNVTQGDLVLNNA